MKLVEGHTYDPTYKKETEATVVGAILMGLSVSLYVFVPVQTQVELTTHLSLRGKLGILLVDLLLRTAATGWVKTIAVRQNRDKALWGLFAFFFPSLVLIIIGLTGKIDRSSDDKTPTVVADRKKLRNMTIGLILMLLVTVIVVIYGFVNLYPKK